MLDYLCQFDMDCVTHSSENPVTVRKLTLQERKTIDIGDNQLTFMEEREYQSLKSQIKSKLAQADFDKTIFDFGNMVMQDVTDGKTVLLKSEDVRKTEQELSQLRPIVQALRELCQQMINYCEMIPQSSESFKQYQNKMSIFEKRFKSIVASSDKNVNSGVKPC